MALRVGGLLPRFGRDPLRLEIPGCEHFEKIEDGGFSTVYRAVQRQFGRRVAVKVLDPRGLGKQGLRSRFERECETLGMLGDHPHVVKVFQAGVGKSGSPYIVMEYLPAGSLADRLDADRPLSWEEVLAIGVKLAGALESAHRAGFLHLDIKPANVLIGPNSEPKLTDFGVARVRAALGVTTQTLILTVGYAAPERFMGGKPTAASDIYSLGVTLFTLLVGHLPFLQSRDEEPWPEVIHGRQLFGPVPELDLGLPEDLRAVMRRAMDRRPEDRFGSAIEFGEALQVVQRHHGLTVTPLCVVPVAHIPRASLEPPPGRHGNRRLAMVSLASVVALVAASIWIVTLPPCTEAKTVPADRVLSFGALLPLSGSLAYQGPSQAAGIRLAAKDINDAGSIPGIAVRVDEANQRDSGDTSTDIASRSTDALLSGGVDVIIGAASSAVSLNVIDSVVCAGVVMMSPANTSPVFSTYPDYGLYFRIAPSDVLQGQALAELVVGDGNSTAVVMARDDPYGNPLREMTVKTIEGSGVRVLDHFSYNPDTRDYGEEVRRAKAQNPDAIVLIGFRESAPILAAMIREGLGPKDKRVYGTDSNVDGTLALEVNRQDPGVLDGMRGTTLRPGPDDPFIERVKEFDPTLQDLMYAPQAYDAVVIIALAAALAGTDAPAIVAKEINDVTRDGVKCADFAACIALVGRGEKNIDYDGVSGPLEFAEPGEPSLGVYVISEIQADGSVKPLRTVEAESPT